MALGAQSARDVYANLLADSRGMRRDRASARERWYAELRVDHKETALFELEMLLKGFACFGNVRNHPGPARKTPSVAHDFVEELRVMRMGIDRAIEQSRELLGERERAFGFSRYLETVLPGDAERTRLLKEQLTQDTPQEALFLLRNAFGNFAEITDGLLRLGRVPHRLHQATLSTLIREIGRNHYFNPLVSLEFRPEFDRIRDVQLLDALHSVEQEEAHRVAALALLTLGRARRYLTLIEAYCRHPEQARTSYILLAVLRSDVRALSRFLSRRSGEVMARGLEREILSVHAASLDEERARFEREAGRLIALRRTCEGVANTLRVELRRVYEQEIPAPDSGDTDEVLAERLLVACQTLRATLIDVTEVIGGEISPQGAISLHAPEDARRITAERLRRDVWMFKHILRGFLAKASVATAGSDRWASYASFTFVKDFLGHFRAIGHQLLRQSDYEQLEGFIASLDGLRQTDLLDDRKLQRAVRECEAMARFLDHLFLQIGKRAELEGVDFDKHAAAETLKIHLGA